MAKLVYSAMMSLDGYTADEGSGFDWAAPDPEMFAFINDLERGIGTYLYGRRMCETMVGGIRLHPRPAAIRPGVHGARRIVEALEAAGLVAIRVETLALTPPVACVMGTRR